MVDVCVEPESLEFTAASMRKVAFVLQQKKALKYFGKGLTKKCLSLGILLQEVVAEELMESGDFSLLSSVDVIVHKVVENTKLGQFIAHVSKQPGPPHVLSDYDLIRPLSNRESMLAPLAQGLCMKDATGRPLELRTVKSVTLQRGTPFAAMLKAMADEGVAFPVIAKPLQSQFNDEASHELYVTYNEKGLSTLLQSRDYVVQEYVAHNATLLKVYNIGRHVVVQKRPSIHIDPASLAAPPDFELLGRISCVGSHAGTKAIELPQDHPDMPSFRQIATFITDKYGLPIYNVDVFQPSEQPEDGTKLLYIIDFNYMPGVNKVAGYEDHLAVAFADLARCRGRRVGRLPAVSLLLRFGRWLWGALLCLLSTFKGNVKNR